MNIIMGVSQTAELGPPQQVTGSSLLLNLQCKLGLRISHTGRGADFKQGRCRHSGCKQIQVNPTVGSQQLVGGKRSQSALLPFIYPSIYV